MFKNTLCTKTSHKIVLFTSHSNVELTRNESRVGLPTILQKISRVSFVSYNKRNLNGSFFYFGTEISLGTEVT